MRVLFLTISLCVLDSGCIFGQKETACATAAYIADPESGVNIRSGAGTNYKIIKNIPSDAAGTMVIIDASKGDWLRISGAVNSRKAAVFEGTGWIRASLLSVKTRGKGNELVEYYGSADTESEAVVVGSIRASLEVILQSCSGVWVKVLIPERETEGKPGWLPHTSYCGSLLDDWEDCM